MHDDIWYMIYENLSSYFLIFHFPIHSYLSALRKTLISQDFSRGNETSIHFTSAKLRFSCLFWTTRAMVGYVCVSDLSPPWLLFLGYAKEKVNSVKIKQFVVTTCSKERSGSIVTKTLKNWILISIATSKESHFKADFKYISFIKFSLSHQKLRAWENLPYLGK